SERRDCEMRTLWIEPTESPITPDCVAGKLQQQIDQETTESFQHVNYLGRPRRPAMRCSAEVQPASKTKPGSSMSITSGAWSEGIGFPLRASRSISAQTTRDLSGTFTRR